VGCRYCLHSGTWDVSCRGMVYKLLPNGEWEAAPEPVPKPSEIPDPEIYVDI